MGEFVALIDVIPEDMDVDFEVLISKLKTVIPDTCVIENFDVHPVAFGLE